MVTEACLFINQLVRRQNEEILNTTIEMRGRSVDIDTLMNETWISLTWTSFLTTKESTSMSLMVATKRTIETIDQSQLIPTVETSTIDVISAATTTWISSNSLMSTMLIMRSILIAQIGIMVTDGMTAITIDTMLTMITMTFMQGDLVSTADTAPSLMIGTSIGSNSTTGQESTLTRPCASVIVSQRRSLLRSVTRSNSSLKSPSHRSSLRSLLSNSSFLLRIQRKSQ